MKLGSHKELDDYIYTNLILELKDIRVVDTIQTPMSHNGDPVIVSCQRLGADTSGARTNHQRRVLNEKQPFGIFLNVRWHSYMIGTYQPRGHLVRLSSHQLDRSELVGYEPVMSRLEHAFKTNTPFTKVVTTKERL